MVDQLGELARTHTCGDLCLDDVGTQTVLMGWVHRVRDMGSLVFFDLRDRDGITQIVARDADELLAAAKRLRSEFVVAIQGSTERRSPETVNPKLTTGEVEVVAREIRVLSESRTPPFHVADESPVAEETRLRYRYLDLRRPRMQHNLHLRHRISMAIRSHLDAERFWEIETPILAKSTPEGARDYLVPSRVQPGKLYALPQSPQIFKQILMIAGTDRYFQIVRCFRDEDLRADRQPEFTQVDIELSFATRDLVFGLVERLMQRVVREVGQEVSGPFQRMSYDEAMTRYGSDKPDLRCDLPIEDLSDLFADSSLGPFREAVASGGAVRGFALPGGAKYSRRELDGLVDQAKGLGAAGLVWARLAADGGVQSPALKAAGPDSLRQALERTFSGEDGLLLMVAGTAPTVSKVLGQLRLTLAEREGLLAADRLAFVWVVDFPLLDWDGTEHRYVSMHHPFTAPTEADLDLLEREPAKVRAKAYDLVLNGSEIGGGSIRIHDADLQRRIFDLLKIGNEEARVRFGFFLEALEYGTPPHGGIALGLDRIVAILAGEQSIREVIAFPKTAAAVDLMTGAPSTVEPRQLRDLHVRLDA